MAVLFFRWVFFGFFHDFINLNRFDIHRSFRFFVSECLIDLAVCNAKKPRAERHTPELVFLQVGQRFEKHLLRDVESRFFIIHSLVNISEDALVIIIVKQLEMGRVALGGFYLLLLALQLIFGGMMF